MQKLEELILVCNEEPIEYPGTIQPFGGLLLCDAASETITAASQNLAAFLGSGARDTIGQPLTDVLPAPLVEQVELLKSQRGHGRNPIQLDGEQDGTIAVVNMRNGVVFIELESISPTTSRDDVFQRNSNPNGFDAYMEFLDAPRRLASACDTVETFLDAVVDTLARFSGFDQVLTYRFEPDESGVVVAEAKKAELSPFLHLRYPASDIPQRARDLYRRQLLRVIPDIDAPQVNLHVREGDASTIDLSLCSARSPSPVHLEYLNNMGVAASMVSSLIVNEHLWGLIACHHYSGARVLPYQDRSAVTLFSSSVAAHIGVLERSSSEQKLTRSRTLLQHSVASIASDRDVDESAESFLADLCAVFEVDGASLLIRERWMRSGKCPPPSVEAELYRALMTLSNADQPLVSDSLRRDHPDIANTTHLRGVLAMRLSPEATIFLWRAEVSSTIRWAGNPQKHMVLEEDGKKRLMPRTSFAEWIEERAGTCLAWHEATIALLLEFRSQFVSLFVRRNEQLDRLNQELHAKNKELDAFTYSVSHDLKSPIVTVKGFLAHLRDELETGSIRAAYTAIDRIEHAVSRMSHLIDEMHELSRVGQAAAEHETVALNNAVGAVLNDLQRELDNRNLMVRVQSAMPDVHVHALSLERLIKNLIVNAMIHGCTKNGMEIRISAVSRQSMIQFTVADDGAGIDPSHHERVFELFQRNNATAQGSGVGLALVLKIATVHGGRAWVESEPGQGAAFHVTLPSARSPEPVGPATRHSDARGE